MTASSVGLFPCRVQPIGLPPAAVSNAPFSSSVNMSSSSSSNGSNMSIRHPPMRHIRTTPTSTEVRRVSRNLFGKAERSEIDQVMRAEYERNCVYMRERYCFDIRNPPSGSENENTTISTEGPLPMLIAKEVELQASKRQRKSYNLTETNDREIEDHSNTKTGEKTPPTLHEKQNASPLYSAPIHKCSATSTQRDENSESYSNVIAKETSTSTQMKAETLNQNISSTTTETIASTPETANVTNSQQQQLLQKQQHIQKLTLCNEHHKINAKQTLITGKYQQI